MLSAASLSGGSDRQIFADFYAPQLCRQALLRRVLAMGILSVCPSVCLSITTRYGFNAR